jgi:hypothetical protein
MADLETSILKGKMTVLKFSAHPLRARDVRSSELMRIGKVVINIQLDGSAFPTDNDWQNWGTILKELSDYLKIKTKGAGHLNVQGTVWLLRSHD